MKPKCAYNTLNKRVVLRRRTQVEDGQGGYDESWEDEATLWASVEPARGYERMRMMQLGATITHEVTLRYRPGVTTAKRLAFRGRIFEIKQALDVGEDNRYLALLCAETAEVYVAPQPLTGYRFVHPDGSEFIHPDGSPFILPIGGALAEAELFLLPDGSEFLHPGGSLFTWR